MIGAIYHVTNHSECRPKIYTDRLVSLMEYAHSIDIDVTDVYCDMNLNQHERNDFDRFLSCCDEYDALITKDYYHISKNTGKCMDIMKNLKNKGVKVFSVVNGSFNWDAAPIDQTLKIATYTCCFEEDTGVKNILTVRNDIFKLFVEKKTEWEIIDQYSDITLHQKSGEQPMMEELIKNRDMYDLILVHKMNHIHWRTANFCRFRDQLQMDIYSLKEGFLKYE